MCSVYIECTAKAALLPSLLALPRGLQVETAVFPVQLGTQRGQSPLPVATVQSGGVKQPSTPGTSRIPACQKWHTPYLQTLRFGMFEKVCCLHLEDGLAVVCFIT